MVTEILLAAYNGEKYLPALFTSLAAQTYQGEMRITCRDDGSHDNTLEILKNSPAHMISGPATGSPKGNFMQLLKHSTGDILFFCDQDDVWAAEKVSLLVEKMQRAQEAYGGDTPILVHCDLSVVDEGGNMLCPSMFRRQQWDGAANTLARLMVQNNVTGCAMCVNRPLRDLMLMADSKDMFMHDWWAALVAAAFGRIVFVDKPLVYYRQHGGNQVGASKSSMAVRAKNALAHMEKGRRRIALTYEQAHNFLRIYGDILPREQKQCVENYLKIPSMGKIARMRGIAKGGYLMQSPVTRVGQMFFV